MANQVLEEAKRLAEDEKDAKFIACQLPADSNAKAVNNALKHLEKTRPELPVLFVSKDEKKIICLAQVPKVLGAQTLIPPHTLPSCIVPACRL